MLDEAAAGARRAAAQLQAELQRRYQRLLQLQDLQNGTWGGRVPGGSVSAGRPTG